MEDVLIKNIYYGFADEKYGFRSKLKKQELFKKVKNSHSVSIGQFGKIIKILKDNKCKKVLFAGKVEKPNFSKLKLDLKGIYYIPRIIKSSKLGDAAILKEVIKPLIFLEVMNKL